MLALDPAHQAARLIAPVGTMTFSAIDVAIFAAFYACVLTLSLVKSRGRKDTAGYFLGGRSLPWWLIGISIVAANISTEQFVGMAGQAAGSVGLAVSAWQLTGIVGIVIVAFTFMPRFLRAGHLHDAGVPRVPLLAGRACPHVGADGSRLRAGDDGGGPLLRRDDARDGVRRAARRGRRA